MVKVYIVAPFEPTRIGLTETVAAAPDVEVIGDAPSLEQMACEIRFREADVLVVDVQALRGGTVPDVYGLLSGWLPSLRVLFLGTPEDARALTPEDVPTFMELETVGFLIKDGPVDRLVHAVHLLASGVFLCETQLIKRISISLFQQRLALERAAHLSEREIEILGAIAEGLSNKEIARELTLSENTVKAHVSHIMTKLSLQHRTELVRFAFTEGIAERSAASKN